MLSTIYTVFTDMNNNSKRNKRAVYLDTKAKTGAPPQYVKPEGKKRPKVACLTAKDGRRLGGH